MHKVTPLRECEDKPQTGSIGRRKCLMKDFYKIHHKFLKLNNKQLKYGAEDLTTTPSRDTHDRCADENMLHIIPGKCKSKQRAIRITSSMLPTRNAGDGVEQNSLPLTDGGNTKWHTCEDRQILIKLNIFTM